MFTLSKTEKLTAALAAAIVAGSLAAAPVSARGPGGGIVAQLEALGLDPAEVRADLEGLSREERRAYLENLGVELPETPVRDGVRANIAEQLEALGLDPEEVRADLEGLSREERRAYLADLGVTIPERPARE
ncbi:MAG: hypothetical protein SFV21_14025 [Rhodospirillaceae bacterium]|nr:hypothetical protein [Rhodospirillaceae bacterium]